MPKKRDEEKAAVANKRSRRHKRTKPSAKRDAPTSPRKDRKEPALEQPCEGPAVEHEEEIVCEGEVEVPMSDDGECVDVETAEDPEPPSVPSTPTPTKSTSSRKMDSGEKAKNSSRQLSTTPSGSKSASFAPTSSAANSVNAKKRKGRRDSGTSSDEERWLTAIESGKLEEVDDEMKKIKDPKLMTARQRAMYERNLDKEPSPGGELLMSLPTGYREKEKPQTAEDIQKAALKSQKRKQLADEKREKDKKKTMERLLKKQETKQRSAARNRATKTTQPMISYRNTVHGATISLPPDHEFPLKAQQMQEPPKPQLCGIAGCGNLKVYSCSKTKLPLCSFACYRKNVQSIKQIMC